LDWGEISGFHYGVGKLITNFNGPIQEISIHFP
jgi:hypothetical protein